MKILKNILISAAILILALIAVGVWAGARESSNTLRLLWGALAGLVLLYFLIRSRKVLSAMPIRSFRKDDRVLVRRRMMARGRLGRSK